MDIVLRFTFGERDAVSLLNWLARCNARLIGERPDVPNLYDSGVVYDHEDVETWCDYIQLLAQRWEDCDGLASARVGELLARGWRALRWDEPGYALARSMGLTSIRAEVWLSTHTQPGEHGLYHCIVRYEIGSQVYWDDPSARLGMLPERLTAWEAHRRLLTRNRLTGPGVGQPATFADRQRFEAMRRSAQSAYAARRVA